MNNQWRENAHHMVIWGDGSYDTSRTCDECKSDTCKIPVHQDFYREIGETRLDNSEAERASGYWEWMTSNQPLGGKRDHDGEMVVNETVFANPDSLPYAGDRSSGVTESEYELAQEAYHELSGKQKEVWDLVMREQVSQTEAARRLGITQQSVNERLQTAEAIFTNHLRRRTGN